MKEIYIVQELFHQGWLNILAFSFYLLAFLLFFLFPLIWLFYFLSEKRGKKFKTLRVQLKIFFALVGLSFFIGIVYTYYKSFGDFDKLETDGNKYIATHSLKFWKKSTFYKNEVEGAYVNFEARLHQRDRAFFIRILFKEGKILKSAFIKYPKNLTLYYNEAQLYAEKILSSTGLNGNKEPVSVYPHWLSLRYFFNRLWKMALLGFIIFAIVAVVFGGILFWLSRKLKSEGG